MENYTYQGDAGILYEVVPCRNANIGL